LGLEEGTCASLGSRLRAIEDATIDALFNNPYDFVISDWVDEGYFYTISIPVSAHDSGQYPIFQTYEKIGLEYYSTEFDSIILQANGNFKVRVLKTPDLRFNGRLIVDE
jgi:hypothetical protein